MPVTTIEGDHPAEVLAPDKLAQMLVATYK
jgi:hypothetical protein